jgi:hypothetical protein
MNSYNGFSGEQRLRAQAWLNKEYKAGRLVRPSVCVACGQRQGVIDTHTEDYSFPFGPHINAHGLCYRCHLILHCRFRAPRAWQSYCDSLAQGVRFRAMYSRDFPRFCRQHLDATEPAPTERVGGPLPGFAAILTPELPSGSSA